MPEVQLHSISRMASAPMKPDAPPMMFPMMFPNIRLLLLVNPTTGTTPGVTNTPLQCQNQLVKHPHSEMLRLPHPKQVEQPETNLSILPTPPQTQLQYNSAGNAKKVAPQVHILVCIVDNTFHRKKSCCPTAVRLNDLKAKPHPPHCVNPPTNDPFQPLHEHLPLVLRDQSLRARMDSVLLEEVEILTTAPVATDPLAVAVITLTVMTIFPERQELREQQDPTLIPIRTSLEPPEDSLEV